MRGAKCRVSDLAYIRAVFAEMDIGEPLKPKALEAEGERFRPYRTVAAWHCWRAMDGPFPVQTAVEAGTK